MSNEFTIRQIGTVDRDNGKTRIEIEESLRPALTGLSGFSHLEVLWWCDQTDHDGHRTITQFSPPFDVPVLGVLASRAPMRPNPIATSIVPLISVDQASGVLEIGEIDAFDGTPILDIKPYIPMYSRVKSPRVATWATGWPGWVPDDGIPPQWMPTGE